MKRILLPCVAAFLLFSSCYSNLYRFRQFDQLEQLSKDTLFVVFESPKEDIRLLEQYGKSKDAQKLKANMEKGYLGYKEAFDRYYTFSPFVFWDLSDHNYQLPDGFYADIVLYDEPKGEGGHETMVALQLKNNEDIVVHSVKRAYSPYVSNFNGMVRQLNKDLVRINQKGLSLKQTDSGN